MSDCCSINDKNGAGSAVKTAVSPSIRCPSCGQKGRRVDRGTVKALISVSLHAVNENSPYRFCRTANCSVVYYNEEGEIFNQEQVRERVHQKHPSAADVFVCYCYRHTPQSIRDELTAAGKTTVIAAVTAGTKAGTCACDIRNPQGSCCLGNLNKVVKRILAERERDLLLGDNAHARGAGI